MNIAENLPDMPDDDTDFTPELARKIIGKYREAIAVLTAAPASTSLSGADFARTYRRDHPDASLYDVLTALDAALAAAPANGADTEAIDRAAKFLRETQQGGKNLTPWEQTPKATKKKWMALAEGTLSAANTVATDT